MMNVVLSFKGPYRFMSNFHVAPMQVRMQGIDHMFTVDTVEHLYQASKTLVMNERMEILHCRTPGQAKRLGAQATLRHDWEQIKLSRMKMYVWLKFKQHPELARQLRDIDYIIEGNYWHDNYWGICTCSTCPGTGENHLGRILMNIRDNLHLIVRDVNGA